MTALSARKTLLTRRLYLCSPSATAMHPLGLLLFCAVSLSSSTELLDNGMPIGWSLTMSSVAELPTQGGVATPDPFNYHHRLSFSRLMIDATSPFMITMGPNPTDNPMWSLSMQLVWMHASGKIKYCIFIEAALNKTGSPKRVFTSC